MDQESILKVYLNTISHGIYAVPVWQLIPGTVADNLETLQKRALRIIFRSVEGSSETLQRVHLDSLAT